ncbi:MAG TPA: biotin/lipoyl-binding protein [Solirubrobacterales bacterium]|nr:biotin/lipoyl-binding protein [Solirubrobacterales bacterium]
MKTRPRLRRPRRLPLPRRPLEWGLAIVAAVLIAIGVTSLGGGSAAGSAATKRTATVGKGVVQSTVSGNGTLEPAQKVELSFGASGEVTAIEVKAGETVKKGQVLAEVDSSSARASLASAEAQLVEAEEAVETAAEAEEEENETEDAVYAGGATTELVGLMSEDGTAATKEEEPKAEEPEAEEESSASAKAKEGAEKAKEGTEAKEETAKPKASKEEAAAPETEGATSTEGSGASSGATESATPAAESSSSSEPSSGSDAAAGASVSLPTAEANLREAELAVRSARQEVRETTLRAPISGTIASVSGSVGETVTAGSSSGGGTSEASSPEAGGGESTGSGSGSAFIVLAQLHRLKMEVDFSESDIGKVRKGQTATVSIDSMEGTELAGRVTKVNVLPSEGSSSVVEYPATILLTQSAKGLRAGMSASAEVVVEQAKDALSVPSEAISSSAGGKTVTVEEDGKEVTKSIKTGLEGDETTEVIGGLKAGETLVLPEVTVATGSAGGSESGSEGSASGFPGGGAGGFSPAGGGGFPSGGGFPGGGP